MTYQRCMRALSYPLAALLVCCLLAGCNLSVLHPKGSIAAREISIMMVSAAFMLIVVIPVIFMTIYISWRYRESNVNSVYAPEWAHSTPLEIIWWSIPCCIIVVLGIITWNSSHELDPFRPISPADEPPLTIQAIALQWKWLFIYPNQNIATINYLQLPVGVPVRFDVTSEGPMNSLLIPQLAGQIYAMAGMQSKLHLIANETGDYQGFSANFSGEGFSGMKFNVHVGTQSEFEKWVNSVKQSHNILGKTEYDRLLIASRENPVTMYSAVNKYLFKIATMKAMMPEKEVEALCRQRSWV